MEEIIREPFVSGSFYPSSKKELKEAVEFFLDKSSNFPQEKKLQKQSLKALIVPHAGYIYSGVVAGSGFKLINKKNNLRIFLLGVPHNYSFQCLSLSSANYWETPLGRVKIEKNLIKKMNAEFPEIFSVSEEFHKNEHSLEVEIPFLQTLLADFTIVPILVGEGETENFALALEKYIEKEDLIVVSSDLSHYYQYNTAITLDKKTMELINNLDFQKMEDIKEACGRQGILTLMHLANKKGWKPVLIDYKNSGDTYGGKDKVVGYASFAFYERSGKNDN